MIIIHCPYDWSSFLPLSHSGLPGGVSSNSLATLRRLVLLREGDIVFRKLFPGPMDCINVNYTLTYTSMFAQERSPSGKSIHTTIMQCIVKNVAIAIIVVLLILQHSTTSENPNLILISYLEPRSGASKDIAKLVGLWGLSPELGPQLFTTGLGLCLLTA